MDNILKHRSFVYGFLALWVMIFHCTQQIELVNIPLIAPFIEHGNMAVDVFMLLSGYCLFMSFDKNPDDVYGYIVKRIKRIIIPYLVVSIPFYIWRCIVEVPSADGSFNIIQFVKFLTSFSFFYGGIQTSWFAYAIFIFGAFIPVIHRLTERKKIVIFIIIAISYILNIVCLKYVWLYRYSSICWTRLPIFLVGIAIAKYSDCGHKVLNNQKIRLIALILFFVIACVFQIRNYVMQNGICLEFLWMSYGPLTICFVVILNWVLKHIIQESIQRTACSFIKSIGNMSFEIYMVHVWIYRIFGFYGIWGMLRGWSYLVLPIISIIATIIFKKIIDKVFVLLHA